jgi:hypothetical protein
MRCALLAVWLTLLTAGAAGAQSIDDYYLDFAVPDLPGLGVVGLTPSKVSRPGPVKELAVSLLSLADDVRTIRPGVAIAWAPKQTFPGQSLDDYRAGVLRRIVVSAATVKSSRRTFIGVGGRFVVLDRTRAVDDAEFIQAVEDAIDRVAMDDVEAVVRRNRLRNDVEGFVVAVTRLVKPGVGPGDADVERLRDVWTLPAEASSAATVTPDFKRAQFLSVFAAVSRARNRDVPPLPSALADELERWATEFVVLAFQIADDRPGLIRTIRERIEKEKWNAATFYVDGGLSWMSADSTWKQLRIGAGGLMVAIGFPLGRAAQGIVQSQYRHVVDEPSSVSIGARLLVGNSRSRLSIEGVGERQAAAVGDRWHGRATAGTEFRVADGLWLEVAAGADFNGPGGQSGVISLANVKYTFRTKPRFVVPAR